MLKKDKIEWDKNKPDNDNIRCSKRKESEIHRNRDIIRLNT